MTTHTPGPWKWLDYPDGRKLLAGATKAVIHCPDAPMACDDADARLIAAAPDLLAALRICRAIIGSGSRGARLRAEPEAIAQAEAALAKAEGGAEAER